MVSTKIVNIASLRGGRGVFHPSQTIVGKVKEAVAAARGRVVAAVHPYFAGTHIFNDKGQIRDLKDYGWLTGYASFARYGRHLRLFDTYLRNNRLPLLLFIEENRYEGTARLIKELAPAAGITISIPTRPADDLPVLNWKTTTGILRGLGIKHILLMGELGYHFEIDISDFSTPGGCVYAVGRKLKAERFNVRYLKHLIYPGTNIACASSNA